MPTQTTSIFSENSPAISYAGAGQKWTIIDGVVVASQNSFGVTSSFERSKLVNKGDVFSADATAVYFFSAHKSTIVNKASGTIFGEQGVILDGGNGAYRNAMVDNDGTIFASNSMGVYLLNTTNSKVENDGSIVGTSYGVYVLHSVAGPSAGSTVVNKGMIKGGTYGVFSKVHSGLKTTVVNEEEGTIEGLLAISVGQGALSLTNEGRLKGDVKSSDASAEDKVINKGKIKGDVFLGGADDTYKNKGGKAGMVFSGDGNDNLVAGKSRDKFVFAGPLNEATNIDRVAAFKSGKDMFFLDKGVFAAIANGVLANSAFEKGKEADDVNDRIIYHKKSGKLYYDEDGLGGTDQIQIAKLDEGQKLAADDFTVIA